MHVIIKYVDDAELYKASPRAWRMMRADGVDYVDLIDDEGHVYRMMGHSIYWLRLIDDKWAIGGGTVGKGVTEEVVAHGSGEFKHDLLLFMPDLQHDQVKLGWWD